MIWSPSCFGIFEEIRCYVISWYYRVTNFGKWCRFLFVMEVWIYILFLEFRPGAEIGTLYVTNPIFPSSFRGLDVVILNLFFPFFNSFYLIHG